jgi:pyruvate dehydrogenase E1 component alpha subunit
MGAHTTSDDPTRYRIASEVDSWLAKDPIARMKAFLDKQQIADASYFDEIDEQARAEAVHLRERVLSMPDPSPETMFDNVYPHGSPLLDAQRAEFAEYFESFAKEAH